MTNPKLEVTIETYPKYDPPEYAIVIHIRGTPMLLDSFDTEEEALEYIKKIELAKTNYIDLKQV